MPQTETSADDKIKELKEKEEELKRLKLELELAETRARLEQEKRRVRMQAVVHTVFRTLPYLRALKRIGLGF